ncbi:MFS transporter [Paludibaculum fermentans]|uniref:MFS transporter n=1 Tax=Paludibaculum fermentans TaxID=1473598 RepID=UPI003EBFB0DE
MLTRNAWWIVALLWVVALLNYLDRQVIFSLFPLLRADLGLTDMELGMLGTAFLWIYAAASPLAGYLGDRFGHRPVILLSLLMWSAVTVCLALAGGFRSLIATRALMGIGEACYIPSALALISAWHGPQTRSRAIGLHQSGIYAGILLGGFGGAWIGENYGWRTVFWVLGAVGIAYAALLPRLLPRTPALAPDRTSSAAFLPTIRSILRKPAFWPVLAVFAVMSMASWLVYAWMPLFLFEKFSLSLSSAGFVATFFVQVASVAGILLGGWLGDTSGRRSARGRLFTQVAGLALAAPFLSLSGLASDAWVLYAALALYGVGRGIYDCNVMPVLCEIVNEEERSSAFGLLNFAGTFSGGLIALLAGALKSTLGLGMILGAVGLAVLGCSTLLLLIPRLKAKAAAA